MSSMSQSTVRMAFKPATMIVSHETGLFFFLVVVVVVVFVLVFFTGIPFGYTCIYPSQKLVFDPPRTPENFPRCQRLGVHQHPATYRRLRPSAVVPCGRPLSSPGKLRAAARAAADQRTCTLPNQL